MNSIINHNLGGGNNPMKPLAFTWIAIFEDGTKIEQFNSEGIENRFQLVKDKFDKLVFFNLTNKEGKLFIVNLREGLIGYNDLVMSYRKSEEEKGNIRLIFFRNHKVEITENCIEKSHIINYHLGFQYNNKLGNNRQIVLIIDEEGNWYLEG